MKLPNGYGSVYKLSGNRRRPWVVKKSVQGKQKAIGYFDSQENALAFLIEYNRDPSLLSPSKTTFAEIYLLWKAKKFPRIKESTRKGYENSYRHCQRLHSMIFIDIRLGHLDEVINDIRDAKAGYCTQKKVRVFIEQLYGYAAKYDLVTRDYAQYIEIDRYKRKYKKTPFSVRQVNKLWRNIDEVPGIRDVLIMLYTGVRIGEYINLQTADVKMRRHYFIVRVSKTEADRNRPVPISHKIDAFIADKLSGDYLCSRPDGKQHSYDSFRRQVFDPVMRHFGMAHTPHETRHTTASRLDSAGANDTAVKMILGHARTGVTKKDYTHKTIRELRKAIDMI